MALGTFARLTNWISERGGSAHSSDLRQAGFTARELAAAVACGELARIQRSWLVVTDCSTHRQFAASVGGRVTCQTGATERGWWTPLGAGDTHVWVPRSASRISASQLITHRALGPVPMPRFATTDAPLNVLFQVARCLPRADALAVWESAVKTDGLSPESLARVEWRSSAAHELARLVSELSDSGLETEFVRLMRTIGIRVRQQVWIDGHPIDAVIGKRLLIQLDGFAHHSNPRDRRRDLQADARLVLLGYTILRFEYHQIMNQPACIISTVRTALAQGLHLSH